MLQLQINGLSEIAMLILCFLDFRLLTPETTLLLLRPWRMDMWRFVIIIIIIIINFFYGASEHNLFKFLSHVFSSLWFV